MSRTNLTNYTISGTLGVTGATTLVGAVTMGSTLGVTGATTLHSTLGVTGASTLVGAVAIGSTLGVTGATTLHSTLGVTGASNLIGAVYVGSTLAVTGATTLHGTLGVTGASTLVGNVGMAGTLGVTGATTLHSTLGVTGASNLIGAVYVGSTLSVTGATTLHGALGVTGATTLVGAVTMGSTLGVTGAVSFRSTLAVTGSVGIGATIKNNQASYPSIDIGLGGGVSGDSASSILYLTSNVYNANLRKNTGYASQLELSSNGTLYFWTGNTGAADATITWTNRFVINETGYVSINKTAQSTAKLWVRGVCAVEGESAGADISTYWFQSGAASTSGWALLSINALGWNGSASGNGAGINFVAEETWTGSAYGTYIAFRTTAPTTTSLTEKMRLTGVGYLGIGATSPDGPLHIVSSSLLAAGSASVVLSGENNTERLAIRSASSSVFHLGYYGGTYAAKTVVTGGTYPGYIQFGGWDGASWHRGAWITAYADENYSTTRRGTSLIFSTALAGADSAMSERVRVMHSGQVLINRTTNTVNAEQLNVEGAIRAKIPTAGLPHATNSETDAAVGLRIHTGASWVLDFGSNNGPGWVQARQYHATNPVGVDLLLNPRGGNVGVGRTSASYPLHVTGAIVGTSSVIAEGELYTYGNVVRYNSATTAWMWWDAGVSRFKFSHELDAINVRGVITSYAQGNFSGDWAVITTIGGAGALQLLNTGAADADQFAGVTFHNAGSYAVNFGLVNSELRVGGWSLGAVSYRIVHEGLISWALYNATVPATTLAQIVMPASASIAWRGSGWLRSNAYYNGADKYIATNTAAQLRLYQSRALYFDTAASGTVDTNITWHSGFRLDKDGIALGGDPVDYPSTMTGHISINSQSTSLYGVHLIGYGSVTSNLFMGSSHGGTLASPTASVAGRQFAIMCRTWDGSAYANTAAIQLEANATCASSDHPTNITFATTPDGSVTRAENMRLDFNGYLLIGYTTSNGAYRLQVNSQIYATNATIATSDARYKERVTSITDGLSVIKELNPVSFFWKEHPVHKFEKEECVGFLAQEVESVFRSKNKAAVRSIIKKNMIRTNPHIQDKSTEVETPDESTPIMEEFLGMSDTALIPFLVSAVKELSEEVDRLKSHK